MQLFFLLYSLPLQHLLRNSLLILIMTMMLIIIIAVCHAIKRRNTSVFNKCQGYLTVSMENYAFKEENGCAWWRWWWYECVSSLSSLQWVCKASIHKHSKSNLMWVGCCCARIKKQRQRCRWCWCTLPINNIFSFVEICLCVFRFYVLYWFC